MPVLYLGPEQIMKVTREPSLYERFSFLMPLRDPALKLHAQLLGKRCKGCNRSFFMKTALYIGAAFTALVDAESKKQPNALAELHQAIEMFLGTQADEIRLVVMKGNDKWEIKF